ncbi:ABC transporter ATP-binding protein [Piscinibacter sp. Jin2]|uniref:ABC transporter ATP-binding protein n=2 Tax=Aquariibacter lacus TaxID=2801332 RepID=A0A9X1BQA8_9BURK|nr:ATP-binding cassette domain-containing protein [Piscinibacter lacus]MBL0718669.1 ABC transporter ATP-binding protein [Piscinibacter lacus]
MSSELRPGTLIVRGAGKAYRRHSQDAGGLWRALRGQHDAATHWVVRGVDLHLAPSQSLGLVGDNGAGKTTLLKLLAGALAPTEGEIRHAGRRAVMLQLGGGFHPELSGRENLRIGCAVMGLGAQEVERLMPEIIDFSELGPALDQPLRTLSSGMQLRLGFALATAVRPDLLIVDEHLSVGDQHFQRKCLRRILDLRASGCTLVLCSHAAYLMSEVCEQVLWLHEGQPRMLDRASATLAAYDNHVRACDAERGAAPLSASAPPPVAGEGCEVLRVEALGEVRQGVISPGQRLVIEVDAQIPEAQWARGVDLGMLLMRNDELGCVPLSSQTLAQGEIWQPIGPARYRARCVIDELPLLSGRYSVNLALLERGSPVVLGWMRGAGAFEVRSAGRDVGLVRVPHRWETVGDRA